MKVARFNLKNALIFLKVICCLYLPFNLQAAPLPDVHKVITGNVNRLVISLLANKQNIDAKPYLAQGIAHQLTSSLLNPVSLSQRVMGPKWRTLSDTYRNIFKFSLMHYVTEEIANALREHSEKIIEHAHDLAVSGVRFSDDRNHATIDVEIASLPKSLASFKLERKAASAVWWISDVHLLGFSLLENFRLKLQQQLSHDGLDIVIQRLKSNTFN